MKRLTCKKVKDKKKNRKHRRFTIKTQLSDTILYLFNRNENKNACFHNAFLDFMSFHIRLGSISQGAVKIFRQYNVIICPNWLWHLLEPSYFVMAWKMGSYTAYPRFMELEFHRYFIQLCKDKWNAIQGTYFYLEYWGPKLAQWTFINTKNSSNSNMDANFLPKIS